MPTSRHWKRLFLLGAASTSLAAILWTTYQFTVLWLRHRYVDELAQLARLLPAIQSSLSRAGALEHDLENPLDSAERAKLVRVIDRLAALDRPRPLVVLEILLTQSENVPESDPTGQPAPIPKFAMPAPAPPRVNLPRFPAPVELITATASGPLGASYIAKFGVLSQEPACYSASDANGQKYWLVIAPRRGQGDMGPFVSGASDSLATQDIIMIDDAGQIVSIVTSNGGILFGKLPEPKGKADQLVFGPVATPIVFVDDKPSYAGTRSVWCIERGTLKRIDEVAFDWTRWVETGQ